MALVPGRVGVLRLPNHRAHVALPSTACPHNRLHVKQVTSLETLSSVFHRKESIVGHRSVSASASKTESGTAAYQPTSAKDAIEKGLQQFNESKNYVEAARLFNAALEMQASDDEMRAALYNLGCAYSKLKQWKPAADSIVRAINDHKLKLIVALKDDDLRQLRDRREWIDALTEVKGGLSRDMKIGLRSEARAPFRFPRFIILGGFAVGAAIGLFIITGRLIRALNGGEGAPDLTESVQNFAINASVLAVLSAILYRDAKEKEKATKVTDREELLSRLQIDLGKGRILPLLKFRGQVRFVILAGTKVFVDKAIKESEPYFISLRERGVSVVPLILNFASPQSELDPDEKIRALKREFQKKDTTKGFGGKSEKTEKADDSPASDEVGIVEEDKRWKLTAFDAAEWQAWVEAQREFANLKGDQRNCYIQVQLDGTVRTSGTGLPNWAKLVDDLPPLDSVRTSFTDGIGPSI